MMMQLVVNQRENSRNEAGHDEINSQEQIEPEMANKRTCRVHAELENVGTEAASVRLMLSRRNCKFECELKTMNR